MSMKYKEIGIERLIKIIEEKDKLIQELTSMHRLCNWSIKQKSRFRSFRDNH